MSRNPDTVRFDVGGRVYRVSRSLIDRFPETMLARIASETWNPKGPRGGGGGDGDDGDDGDTNGAGTVVDEPIFLERDGERFRHVLDYMRDGRADLPASVSREAFLRDLDYYGFDRVEPSSVDYVGLSGMSQEEGIRKDCDAVMKYFVRNYTYAMTPSGRQQQHCTGIQLGLKLPPRLPHYRQTMTLSCYPLENMQDHITNLLSEASYDAFEAANRIFADQKKRDCLNRRFLEYGLKIESMKRKKREHDNGELIGKLEYWEVILGEVY